MCRLMCVGYGLRTLEVLLPDCAKSCCSRLVKSLSLCCMISPGALDSNGMSIHTWAPMQVRFDMEQTMLLDERDPGSGNYLPS